MKRIRFTLLFAVLISLFASCSKDEVLDAYGKPEDNDSYTIMMYGCGGGDLDFSMIQNIEEALLIGTSDKVKFTGQVNFSKEFQAIPATKNTQRFIIGNTPGQEYEPTYIFDELLNLAEPENLTDFIKWSKKQCPSDNYILLLWNHGGGWMPEDDAPQSKGIIFDDNHNNECLTLNNLVKGIEDSNTKLKMIYFDACLMGTLEVITGIKECADYVMGASHITPGIGGDYNSLIHHLGTKTNFEDSMKEYCRETVAHWSMSNDPLDLKVIKLDKLDNFLKEVKVFADLLNEVTDDINLYLDKKAAGTLDPDDTVRQVSVYNMFNKAINSCYHYHHTTPSAFYPFFDILYFAEYFTASGTYNPYAARFVDIASRLNRSWNQAVVCSQISAIARNYDFSIAVTIVDDFDWKDLGYNTAYNGLVFDQITNWGTWLSKNRINPVNNPDPETFNPNQNSGENQGEDQGGNQEQNPEENPEENPGENPEENPEENQG